MNQPKDKESASKQRVTPNFLKSELACRCCGELKMPTEMLIFIEAVRKLYGKAMVVNSGYRCVKHNASVGGVKESAHTKGLAVDIKCTDPAERSQLVRAAIKCGVQGIGLYINFTHLDLMRRGQGPVIWIG